MMASSICHCLHLSDGNKITLKCETETLAVLVRGSWRAVNTFYDGKHQNWNHAALPVMIFN